VKPVDAHLEELWSDDVRVVPKAAFASAEIYQLELEKIFLGPVWHAVAHIAELPNPDDFKSTYLGETPILVVHQKDGQIKAFYNACTQSRHSFGDAGLWPCRIFRMSLSPLGIP